MIMNTNQPRVFNYYDRLDTETKWNWRKNNYTSMILSYALQMFKIDGLSDDYKNLLMSTIFTTGSALLKKSDGDKWIVCHGDFVGVPLADEVYPREYLAVKPSGDGANGFYYDKDVTTDDTATVCYVNPFLAPVTEIQRFAVQLADTDTSMVNNIKYCRIAPIGCVQNDKARASYEGAVERMLNGELVNTVHTEMGLSGELINLSTIDISQGQYAEKLQYLSMYHEQLLSRLCKTFGISYNMISKNANVTNDELDSVDVFASILPTSMKECLNGCLSKIGLKAEFTAPWKWIDKIYEIKMSGLDKPNNTEPTEQPEQTDQKENTESED